jgi:hypothetical protein
MELGWCVARHHELERVITESQEHLRLIEQRLSSVKQVPPTESAYRSRQCGQLAQL